LFGVSKLNKSFIHQANRKTDRNWDAKKLDPIQTILLRYGISTVRERETYNEKFETKNKIRIPDLTDTKHKIILEHDTFKIHGELSSPNERTERRNKDYKRAGINFVVINEDLCKELGLDESKLAVYLYYHELMKSLLTNNVEGKK
jgi:hypothetical protein